jgi:hypothetical protein
MCRLDSRSVGQSLKRDWASHNLDINPGVSQVELSSFEKRYGIVMPGDFRDYFLNVNGMSRYAVDDDVIRFWMLEEVKPLDLGAPDYSDGIYIQNPKSLFLFADYSIWAHAYAIRLGNAQMQSNEVVIIGNESSITICESFSEFVDAYLRNKELLFGVFGGICG